MKNITYLKIIFFSLTLFSFSCKQNNSSDQENEEPVTKVIKENISQVTQKEPKTTITDFQGIWESFSYYLEHESEFKDFNKNKYYKVIKGKETLNITLIDGNKDSLEIYRGYLGFWDSFDSTLLSSENSLKENLNESGKFLVRFKKGLKEYNKEDVETSTNFSRYFEITEVFDDDFNYDKEPEKFSFKTLSGIPEHIFSALKKKSKDGVNYIEEYNIKQYSSKIKVITEKTFFHNEKSKNSKRKAFLVKNDIAYLEEEFDDWVKVYFDGKIISSGYLKRADIEILK
ncbi:hypothetical protein D1816_08560 [Aquimarina sp. AD10]|uniref:hypothetical protein n=1 Tax=Aquimarina sp. AD10 TaxID=1714849 RepID=UPI000E517437|nr:hypothetical protein [Aquimarina sp. AD10]AXT60398.1 hypothetical protein D1816_08560 [Aquimarina sp. AD10]RKN01167.1 hypothetical protein D7033_04925 [Aquimarina sp. AD10]